MLLTKTDFLIARDCSKNAWLKVHKPDIYREKPLTDFDLNIIETGNEIDALARELFPGGVLVEQRDDTELTRKLMVEHTPVIYQPVFATSEYKAVADIIVWNDGTQTYDLYEVKSSTAGENSEGRKTDEYVIDLAFQKNVIEMLGAPVSSYNLVRLNKEYVRGAELSIPDLFITEDLSAKVDKVMADIGRQMAGVREFLLRPDEPVGYCDCINKTKNNHCSTSWYSLAGIPEYSVHRIARIHKTKLSAFVESETLDIQSLSYEQIETLSEIQQRQVNVAQSGKPIIDTEGVEAFLGQLEYPLSFIDYETYPSAIPRFSGYRPYQQIPFQFSLHTIAEPGAEVVHTDFLHTDNTNPDIAFIEAMRANLPASGSILVWNQKFEKSLVNKPLAERNPSYADYIESVQGRIVDLMDMFDGNRATFWHPAFKGSASIKYVLPVLVPNMSYKGLLIQDGGMAADTWNRIVTGEYDEAEKQKQIDGLREYCGQDTYAMVKIWEVLANVAK
jgi:hypothetical protein